VDGGGRPGRGADRLLQGRPVRSARRPGGVARGLEERRQHRPSRDRLGEPQAQRGDDGERPRDLDVQTVSKALQSAAQHAQRRCRRLGRGVAVDLSEDHRVTELAGSSRTRCEPVPQNAPTLPGIVDDVHPAAPDPSVPSGAGYDAAEDLAHENRVERSAQGRQTGVVREGADRDVGPGPWHLHQQDLLPPRGSETDDVAQRAAAVRAVEHRPHAHGVDRGVRHRPRGPDACPRPGLSLIQCGADCGRPSRHRRPQGSPGTLDGRGSTGHQDRRPSAVGRAWVPMCAEDPRSINSA
jgi:hypothetical protein